MHHTPVSVFLPDRAVVSVTGKEAASFLQGLVSCDVNKIKPGQASLGALLSPQGKFLFDFFLIRDGEGFLLDTQQGRVEELLKKLAMYRLRAAVEIVRREDIQVMAVLGNVPSVEEGAVKVADPRHEAMGWRVYTTGKIETTGEFAAYDKFRLALGLPDGIRDAVVERSLLLENGYDKMGGVDFAKGCYVGQEVTARSKHRGELRKYLFIVKGEAPLPEAGTELKAGQQVAGVMRSSCDGIGLALMRTDVLRAAGEEGTRVEAEGRELDIIAPWWHEEGTNAP